MSLGKRIASLRKKRNLSQADLAKALNMSTSTIAMWETDARDPDTQMLSELANFFNVTSDLLLGRDDDSLNTREERDIAKDIERILNDLESEEALAFYGEGEWDEESKELLRLSLEQSMRLARQMAKKKFTPKKYMEE